MLAHFEGWKVVWRDVLVGASGLATRRRLDIELIAAAFVDLDKRSGTVREKRLNGLILRVQRISSVVVKTQLLQRARYCLCPI